MLSYSEPPIQRILAPIFEDAGIRVWIRREDLNHPEVAGNKWWKLKYNIEEALNANKRCLLTFGGAFSNHIYATAAAAYQCGHGSIGLIRGEETLPINPILSFARSKGMRLFYVSREEYRNKTDVEFIQKLRNDFGEFHLIPEGGTNEAAIRGCRELGEAMAHQDCDYVCLPVGTGGTIAGITLGLNGRKKILGFSVLKGGEFLAGNVSKLLKPHGDNYLNWQIETNYHFGGYARTSPALDHFISSFNRDIGIRLEPVYTGKMMYGIYDLVLRNKFERGAVIMILHTGGVHAG